MPRHVAVLLDLDQTLIDSRKSIIQTMRHVFQQELGIDLSQKRILELWGNPIDKLFLGLAGPDHAPRLESIYNAHLRTQGQLLTAFAGWPETLAELRDSGYRLAVVTSRTKDMAKWCLKQVELDGLFEALVSLDDVNAHKPDPEPFLLAAQLLGVTVNSCLAVGDSPFDIIGAKRAGMTAALAEWDFLAWGVRPPAVEDPNATPDIRLSSPVDLLPHCPPLIG